MNNQTNGKEQVSVAMPAQRKMILSNASPFALQEAYKTLRTNMLFALRGKGCKRFCITSSIPGEGKSITILNLAISIAQTGKKVLLIDSDPQASLTISLGFPKPDQLPMTLSDVMGAAMMDQPVMCAAPRFLGNDCTQLHFCTFRIFCIR